MPKYEKYTWLDEWRHSHKKNGKQFIKKVLHRNERRRGVETIAEQHQPTQPNTWHGREEAFVHFAGHEDLDLTPFWDSYEARQKAGFGEWTQYEQDLYEGNMGPDYPMDPEATWEDYKRRGGFQPRIPLMARLTDQELDVILDIEDELWR